MSSKFILIQTYQDYPNNTGQRIEAWGCFFIANTSHSKQTNKQTKNLLQRFSQRGLRSRIRLTQPRGNPHKPKRDDEGRPPRPRLRRPRCANGISEQWRATPIPSPPPAPLFAVTSAFPASCAVISCNYSVSIQCDYLRVARLPPRSCISGLKKLWAESILACLCVA